MGFEDLIALLVRRWKLILACFSLCLLCAGAYVAFSEPVYRSQAQLTLAPSPDSSLSGLSGQLGGLASLAGIQIAGQGERDEVLSSRACCQFFFAKISTVLSPIGEPIADRLL